MSFLKVSYRIFQPAYIFLAAIIFWLPEKIRLSPLPSSHPPNLSHHGLPHPNPIHRNNWLEVALEQGAEIPEPTAMDIV
jgi:hypothetical protein